MTTDKLSVARLVEICKQKGVRHVVFSPGSRNAPLVIAFNADPSFEIFTIHDERVAAFFAMGIALKTKETVAICCTSGTAVLNYAPAIAEAFYQGIPLLILTADRPVEWIDQGIGQSMRQNGVYKNYIKANYQILQNPTEASEIRYNDRIVNEAINVSQCDKPGPVHINIPLAEPLYNKSHHELNDIRLIHDVKTLSFDINQLSKDILSIVSTCPKKLILVGASSGDSELERTLNRLVDEGAFVVLTETTSNLYVKDGIQCIDRVIEGMDETEDYLPDLLITLGGPVISKKIKSLFQKRKPKFHFDIRPDNAQDTFGALTHYFRIPFKGLDKLLANFNYKNDVNYQNTWIQLNKLKRQKHNVFCENVVFSDFALFNFIFKYIKANTDLHLSNSTVIRYAQLFDQNPHLRYFANRGVSGIDGSSSTAIGYATVSNKNNLLITGDVSFFYDSNAFWLKYIPSNLKIILVNNEGGNIFRIIPGPKDSEYLEEHFEAHHIIKASKIAETFGINYVFLSYDENFEQKLKDFLFDENLPCTILEVFTPRKINSKILKDYFKFLV